MYRHAEPFYIKSLFELQAYTLAQEIRVDGKLVRPELVYCLGLGARVSISRRILADQAVEMGADYLLWIDGDQTFPPEGFVRLARHQLPVVGCNYPVRNVDNAEPSAFRFVDGEKVRLQPGSGVEPADVIGLGFCLVQGWVLSRLPKPWFLESDEGEDGYFCSLLKSVGITPHVDHDLSYEIGHVAEGVLKFNRPKSVT
jgi:hypothetical protein